TALALDAAVLTELDALLADREDGLSGQRWVTLGAALGVLVAVGLLVWLAVALALARDRVGSEDPDTVDGTTVPPPTQRELVNVGSLHDLEDLVQARGSGRARHRESDGHAR